ARATRTPNACLPLGGNVSDGKQRGPFPAARPPKGGTTNFAAALLVLALALVGGLTTVLAAEATAATEKASILIGLLLPPEEAEAASLRQGVTLAVEHANKSPGRRVAVVIRGRVGQWGADGEEAARMVLDDSVRGLIAPPGGVPSHLTLQVAGRTAVPVVSLCPDSSVTGAGIPWMVRIAPQTSDEALAIFTGMAVKSTAGTPRWGVFVPEGRAGREAVRDLEKAAAIARYKFIKSVEIPDKSADFQELSQQMLQAKPDAILLWLNSDPAGRLAMALSTAGFAGLLAGPGRLRSGAFVDGAGNAAENFVVPGMVVDKASRELSGSFAAAFRQQFGSEPDPTAAMAYDAAGLLSGILRKSGEESVHRAFPLTGSMPGASGSLRFDGDGNRIVALSLLVCREGRFKPIAGHSY
ncbi:MAG: amino acid ABC transporter substrate-binding protein, partial [Chloroflexi bacterium]|nr:amino acid ABC transporter substrate-binding protein [Chloroflexota bacterium]